MFKSGILDRTRLVSNILMFVLLCGNIYFSSQFIQEIKQPQIQSQDNVTLHIRASSFLKTFIDKVLNTQGTISFADRVQLENDIQQINDPVVTSAWQAFVGSKNTTDAQKNAVTLMSLLVDRV